jgi:hypothetical protein
MPTVLLVDGFRFYFYSNEGTEPPHVHVEKGDGAGKWWLDPVSVVWHDGFTKPQLRRINMIVLEHRERLLEAWDDYFE